MNTFQLIFLIKNDSFNSETLKTSFHYIFLEIYVN